MGVEKIIKKLKDLQAVLDEKVDRTIDKILSEFALDESDTIFEKELKSKPGDKSYRYEEVKSYDDWLNTKGNIPNTDSSNFINIPPSCDGRFFYPFRIRETFSQYNIDTDIPRESIGLDILKVNPDLTLTKYGALTQQWPILPPAYYDNEGINIFINPSAYDILSNHMFFTHIPFVIFNYNNTPVVNGICFGALRNYSNRTHYVTLLNKDMIDAYTGRLLSDRGHIMVDTSSIIGNDYGYGYYTIPDPSMSHSFPMRFYKLYFIDSDLLTNYTVEVETGDNILNSAIDLPLYYGFFPTYKKATDYEARNKSSTTNYYHDKADLLYGIKLYGRQIPGIMEIEYPLVFKYFNNALSASYTWNTNKCIVSPGIRLQFYLYAKQSFNPRADDFKANAFWWDVYYYTYSISVNTYPNFGSGDNSDSMYSTASFNGPQITGSFDINNMFILNAPRLVTDTFKTITLIESKGIAGLETTMGIYILQGTNTFSSNTSDYRIIPLSLPPLPLFVDLMLDINNEVLTGNSRKIFYAATSLNYSLSIYPSMRISIDSYANDFDLILNASNNIRLINPDILTSNRVGEGLNEPPYVRIF